MPDEIGDLRGEIWCTWDDQCVKIVSLRQPQMFGPQGGRPSRYGVGGGFKVGGWYSAGLYTTPPLFGMVTQNLMSRPFENVPPVHISS